MRTQAFSAGLQIVVNTALHVQGSLHLPLLPKLLGSDMTRPALDHLLSLLEEQVESLPGVSRRKMFGCEAFFRDGSIFGMIWKEGRIALKLPHPPSFEEMMALPGAAPWTAGSRSMSHWAFVPESFHDEIDALAIWTRRAWEQAATAPQKPRAKAPSAGSSARAAAPRPKAKPKAKGASRA